MPNNRKREYYAYTNTSYGGAIHGPAPIPSHQSSSAPRVASAPLRTSSSQRRPATATRRRRPTAIPDGERRATKGRRRNFPTAPSSEAFGVQPDSQAGPQSAGTQAVGSVTGGGSMGQAPSVDLESQNGVESVSVRPATPLVEASINFEAGLQEMLEIAASCKNGHLLKGEKVMALRRVMDKVNQLDSSIRCTGQPMTEEQEQLLVDIKLVNALVGRTDLYDN
ncbi:hypothetical protein VPNG_05796 [Cytospora leucostoma]|uniref:Uncharacterized protein n=1 Tax=Cytospora leucostoma TaxID=1230097 RepID=A0A423X0H6_9PEZI|nr:hypothetical protein VPNG_05796 [Cytospora leucostoma]